MARYLVPQYLLPCSLVVVCALVGAVAVRRGPDRSTLTVTGVHASRDAEIRGAANRAVIAEVSANRDVKIVIRR